MSRIGGRELVDASVTQVQLQLALAAVGNYNRFLRQCQARDALVGAGQEDPLPTCGGGIDVIYVEDHSGESFIEDARSHLIGSLPGAQAVFDACGRCAPKEDRARASWRK